MDRLNHWTSYWRRPSCGVDFSASRYPWTPIQRNAVSHVSVWLITTGPNGMTCTCRLGSEIGICFGRGMCIMWYLRILINTTVFQNENDSFVKWATFQASFSHYEKKDRQKGMLFWKRGGVDFNCIKFRGIFLLCANAAFHSHIIVFPCSHVVNWHRRKLMHMHNLRWSEETQCNWNAGM